MLSYFTYITTFYLLFGLRTNGILGLIFYFSQSQKEMETVLKSRNLAQIKLLIG